MDGPGVSVGRPLSGQRHLRAFMRPCGSDSSDPMEPLPRAPQQQALHRLSRRIATRRLHPPGDQPPFALATSRYVYPSLLTILALIVVAVLAGYLAKRLRQNRGVSRSHRTRRAWSASPLWAASQRPWQFAIRWARSRAPSISFASRRDSQTMNGACVSSEVETIRLNDLVGDAVNLARPRSPMLGTIDLARIRAGRGAACSKIRTRRRGDVVIRYDGPAFAHCSGGRRTDAPGHLESAPNAIQATAADAPVLVRVSPIEGDR